MDELTLYPASTDPLAFAIAIAATAHSGQLDKGGAPYILHPLRVMSSVNGFAERIVAVLHDVLEDSRQFTADELRAVFGTKVGDALDALTKRKGEPYDAYLSRVGANAIARTVKMADLADNSDLRRLNREPTVEDARRQAKYQEAAGYLFSLPSPQQQEMK